MRWDLDILKLLDGVGCRAGGGEGDARSPAALVEELLKVLSGPKPD